MLFRFLSLMNLCLISVFVYAGGPKPGLCCLLPYGDSPRSQALELKNTVWNIKLDWSCMSEKGIKDFKHEKRQWVLNDDGSCYDGTSSMSPIDPTEPVIGNTCIWGAENGLIWIDFITLPLHFRGTYSVDKGSIGTKSPPIVTIKEGKLFDDSCTEGCVALTEIAAGEPVVQVPTEQPKKDDYGLSTARVLDPVITGTSKFYRLQSAGQCTADGDAVVFSRDGSCSLIGLNHGRPLCYWSAYNGIIKIDFSNGRHMKGLYNTRTGVIESAVITEKDCTVGCTGATTPWIPMPSQLPPIAPPTYPSGSGGGGGYYQGGGGGFGGGGGGGGGVVNPHCTANTSGCT